MSRSTTHPLQPQTDSSGLSRKLSVLAGKRAIRSVLERQFRADYQARASDDSGKKPASELQDLPSYRLWASSNRVVQDRMWSVLAEQVDADYERIQNEAGAVSGQTGGSLELVPADPAPDYIRQACIHGQPGGYMLDRSADDLAAGILYEAGGNIYALGQGIGKKDSKGERLIAYIRETRPDFQPRRILEMGCSAGAQSTDYPLAFPQAEFHAIDVSPAMLRYAHARAETLGAAVHFHQDVPIQTGRFDALGQFMSEWQKENNDEPFWLDFANADLPAMLEQAGFAKNGISSTYLQAKDGPIPWYVVTATRV